MRNFFTADCHFGHANIIKYTNRPFKDITHMNEEIIRRWNEKVRDGDVVYHVGDFAFKGSEISHKWEQRLNGKIVHIAGNHDYNNGVKSLIQVAFMQFGNLEVMVQHQPPTMVAEVPDYIDLILSAHVHDHWKVNFLKELPNIPMINVGVDVWGFQPVSIDSLLKYYDEVKKNERKTKV
jgi:calcineurin-like phosphoesterase family protein